VGFVGNVGDTPYSKNNFYLLKRIRLVIKYLDYRDYSFFCNLPVFALRRILILHNSYSHESEGLIRDNHEILMEIDTKLRQKNERQVVIISKTVLKAVIARTLINNQISCLVFVIL